MTGQGRTQGLVEFAFTSKVVEGLPAAVCLRLARQAWNHNIRMDLTGELRLADGEFSEVIEGPSAVVLPLAARILGDPRHEWLRITAFGTLRTRRYSAWSMSGFEMDAEIEPALRSAGVTASYIPEQAASRWRLGVV